MDVPPPNPCPEESGEEWMVRIKYKVKKAFNDNNGGVNLWPKHCIYRIPIGLRDACKDKKVYLPQVVSLGPYHHGKKRLRDMEPHKWRALERIMGRTGRSLEHYITEMKNLEQRARDCYEGPIMASSNAFVEMMVLDTAFLHEILLRLRHNNDFEQHLGYSSHDPIFGERIESMIISDTIKLENQIPLFLLGSLFGRDVNLSLIGRQLLRIFNPFKPTGTTFDDSVPLPEGDGLHLLEAYRQNLLAGRAPQNLQINGEFEEVPCVTELKEAGIEIKKRDSDRFWDIQYNNGVLEIPQLLFQDGTESVLLNLIAYEQCHIKSTNDIASYVLFMDSLIDTHSDVSDLRNCGIIKNWMGSDAMVAELFNRMGQGIPVAGIKYYLSSFSRRINHDYRHKQSWRHIASLRYTYFNSPWTIISFIAAVVLLIFTAVQSFYSVYAYYVPKSSPPPPPPHY